MSTPPNADLPTGFPVIELRRYTVQLAERTNFGRAFETYFPEAFQQLGSIIFGQFLEREDPSRFTWIRGFHDVPARKTVNEAFYDGPLWREHRGTMNDRLIDHTDVLLLRPVAPEHEHEIPVLPTVDAIRGTGAHGLVWAHIFAVKPEALADVVDRCRAIPDVDGVRPGGLLVSLDVPDNFPRLPFHTDIPYVVRLAIARDEAALARAQASDIDLARVIPADTLRRPAEVLVLEPTPRSRLRWT
jgi:hypothetical protein